jgi:hypothetical protein
MTPRRLAILAIVVSAMVGAVIWFLRSDPATTDSPFTKTRAIAASRPVDVPVDPKAGAVAPSASRPPAPAMAPVQKAVPVPTEDDRKIAAILRLYPGNSAQDHTSTAQALINLLPTLTEDGQVGCIRHVSNLLSDDQFGRAMPIWQNPDFNADVLEVLSADLMKRGHKVMLPAMVDAVRSPTHPFHEEAKRTLHIFLDADHGDDAARWDAAVKEFLRKEAEEAK